MSLLKPGALRASQPARQSANGTDELLFLLRRVKFSAQNHLSPELARDAESRLRVASKVDVFAACRGKPRALSWRQQLSQHLADWLAGARLKLEFNQLREAKDFLAVRSIKVGVCRLAGGGLKRAIDSRRARVERREAKRRVDLREVA